MRLPRLRFTLQRLMFAVACVVVLLGNGTAVIRSIAFPVTTTGRQGGTFAKMFHLYNLNRDDYLSHYHKRSNVETTFSMIKAKFGDSLRSKTDSAMVNEALCKPLCHNLCCLVQSAEELGVVARFWETEEEKALGAESVATHTEIDAWEWI